jgi:deoxyribonuclease-4
MQIFSHNPRQWQADAIPEEQAAMFRQLRKAYDISPVYVHTSYLINLAALDPSVLLKSVHLLITEMDLADSLGADYVVLHTGSASKDDASVAGKRAVEALRRVAGEKSWRAKLLLENTAGERGDISSRMADLAEIMAGTDSPLIAGVCIDTCHAFAAGYDLCNKGGIDVLAAEVKRYLGKGKVRLVHLNDSKKGCNSHVDRHEHIGQGGIGTAGLQAFINHALFKDVPLVLETPKKSESDDKMNLETVRGLLA